MPDIQILDERSSCPGTGEIAWKIQGLEPCTVQYLCRSVLSDVGISILISYGILKKHCVLNIEFSNAYLLNYTGPLIFVTAQPSPDWISSADLKHSHNFILVPRDVLTSDSQGQELVPVNIVLFYKLRE